MTEFTTWRSLVDGEEISTIPDSELDHRWKMDEGSGSTLSDSVGSVSATLNGATWLSNSKYTGGVATDYDGVDDWWGTDENIDINGEEATVLFWGDTISPQDDFARLMSTSPSDSDNPVNGWQIVFEQQDPSQYGIALFENESSSFAFRDVSGPDASSQDLFYAITLNGDTARLQIFDDGGRVFDESGSASRGQTSDAPLTGMAGNDRYNEGVQDDVMARASELSDQTIEDIWAETGGERIA